jgi:hypothetical protein
MWIALPESIFKSIVVRGAAITTGIFGLSVGLLPCLQINEIWYVDILLAVSPLEAIL